MKCPICGKRTFLTDSVFCAAHAMFALLWAAVRAGKCSDWFGLSANEHPRRQTSYIPQVLRPDWRAQVEKINDRASWWLRGQGGHANESGQGDAA